MRPRSRPTLRRPKKWHFPRPTDGRPITSCILMLPPPQPNRVTWPHMDRIAASPVPVRGEHDRLAWDLRCCGGAESALENFLVMDEGRKPVEALHSMNFQVWKLPSRHGPYCRTRLGPRADGSLSNQILCPQAAVRLCSPWEVLALLETPCQSGRPPIVRTDASLGFSIMAY